MKIFEIIIQVLLALTIILNIIGFIMGVVFAIMGVADGDKKTKTIKLQIALCSFFIPPALLLLLLTMWGFVGMLTYASV